MSRRRAALTTGRNATLFAAVRDRLMRDLAVYYPEDAAASLRLADAGQVAGSDNPVWFFDVTGCTSDREHRLVAKHLAEHSTAADALEREYAMLRALHGHPLLQACGCGVPRPLAAWEDLRTLVMERVPGRRLLDRVRSDNRLFAPASVHHLGEAMARCGHCLAALHRINRIEDEHILESGRDHLGKLHARLENSLAQGAIQDLLGRRRRDELERCVAAATQRLSGQGTPLVRGHGDYALGNLLSDGQALWVIDFAFSHPGLIHHDLSRFLVTLETINPYPRNPLYHFGALGQYRRAFLSAYFGELSEVPERDWLLLSLCGIAALGLHCRRREREYGRTGMGGRMYLAALRPVYRLLIGRELERLRRLLD